MCSLGIEPMTFCAANAMLYHWATGTVLTAGEGAMDQGSSGHCTMAEGEPSSVDCVVDILYMQTYPLFSRFCLNSVCSELCLLWTICLPWTVCLPWNDPGGRLPVRRALSVGSRDVVCVGGTHRPWTLCLSGLPTHHPSTASSCHPCLSSATAVSWQPLCSPSARACEQSGAVWCSA